MKIGAKMKMLRHMHELTQVKLAGKAGVTQAYVARIESEKVSNPKASGIAGIAKVLEVPVELLLDDHLTIEEWQKETKSIRMDDAGRELLSLYRQLSPKQKQNLIDYARFIGRRQK